MTEGNRLPRRVLHTSDLHLTALGDTACHSLVALVDLANQVGADLLLVAGDLFDHNRVPDSLAGFVVKQLERVRGHVVILPGNHDCLAPGSVFDRGDVWERSAKIRVFRATDGECLSLPDKAILLWGKAIDSYEHDVRPLAGLPRPVGNAQWNVAVAHGYYISRELPLLPSYHITEEEIVTSGWDYIALGHLVTFRCVCDEPVKAYYSGSPSFAGTVAIVDLAEEFGIQVRPYSLPRNQYDIIPAI